MDADELLKLLDLKPSRADSAAESALSVSGGPETERSRSPTALEVDEWGLRRGRDLLSESERLRGLGLDDFAIADCHAAAFDPEPRLAAVCCDAVRGEFFAALLASPEHAALHAATRLEPAAAEIAAIHFAEQLSRMEKEAAALMDPVTREVACLRAAARALSEADCEVRDCRDVASAFGCGQGGAGANDPRTIADLFRKVRADPSLRRICSLAGRFRRLAQSCQRRKTSHGLDDIVGVELGGELARALPYELGKLMVPELETDTLRRLVERQMFIREHHALEPSAKGPIIVCVDESGSMEGEPVHSAKALALALAWIARQQRRWSALIAYSGDSGERLLALPAHRWDEDRLAEWLCSFLGRGSTLDVPIHELPRMYAELKAPLGDTDIIALTDCRCSIPAETCERFLAWKRSVRTRFITLALSDDPGDLNRVSDVVHLVRSLDVNEDAVRHVLSI
jgi:uncharacterized protein with von Willebrand factor type A (vWA) domain